MSIPRFHLAIPVRDLAEAKHFYHHRLGFTLGRQDTHWIDYDCFGHQLVTHLNPKLIVNNHHNTVDGEAVPVPHFGVILPMEDWLVFSETIKGVIDEFIIEPTIRFANQPGEQATMFFSDPSGNALEFKSFADIDGQLFATD